MDSNSILKIHPGTKKVISVMILLTLGLVLFSYNHYRGINRSVDPRIVDAKKAFGHYNKLMAANQYDEALRTLDKIERIYQSAAGYENSFELGVVNINRGSVFLIQVETEFLSEKKTIVKENLSLYLKFAGDYTKKGIAIYQNWRETFGKLNESELNDYLKKYFKKENSRFKGFDLNKIIAKRLEVIKEARIEMNRRLSVAYTNLGVILRYEEKNAQSKKCYEEALKLWPENHFAENNLRVLHGKKIKKRTIIEQVFPKERIEKAKENMAK